MTTLVKTHGNFSSHLNLGDYIYTITKSLYLVEELSQNVQSYKKLLQQSFQTTKMPSQTS